MSLHAQGALARRAVHSFVRPIRRRALLTLGGTLLVAVAAAAEPLAMKALVDRLTHLAGRRAGAARAAPCRSTGAPIPTVPTTAA